VTELSVDPDATLDIKWSNTFAPVLAALIKRLAEPSNKTNVRLFARALIELISDGVSTVTARDVAVSVYEDDKPRGGWTGHMGLEQVVQLRDTSRGRAQVQRPHVRPLAVATPVPMVHHGPRGGFSFRAYF